MPLLLCASLLAGCVGWPARAQPGVSPAGATPAAPLAEPSLTQPAPTATYEQTPAAPSGAFPTRTPQPTRAALPTRTPSPTLPPRPPSGWSLFSNPDDVQQIALYENQLWAASLGGVTRWTLEKGPAEARATLFTTRDGLAEIHASAIEYCAYPEGRIIVGHHNGMLSEYHLGLHTWSQRPILFADGSGFPQVQALQCDAPNRRLLAGSPAGLAILDLDTGQWRLVGAAQGLKVNTIRSISVVGQVIWVAAGDSSAYMIQGSTVFPFNSQAGFPSGPVNDLALAPDQSVWLGYPTGLVHYADRKWNSYGAQTSAGIPFYSVEQVEIGPDRRVWIVSADSGICPFEPSTLTCRHIYRAEGGFPVTDLVVDRAGVAYIATAGGGVMALDREQVTRLAFDNQQLISNAVSGLAQDANGTLWVATDQGINLLDPTHPFEPWQHMAPARGRLAFPRVSGLQPAAGGIWLFYDQRTQASFFDGEAWRHLDALTGLAGPVLASALDRQGYVWMAAHNAVNVWDGVVLRTYAPENSPPDLFFQALHAEGDAMWVGTNRGLYRYQNYQWHLALPGVSVQAIQPNGPDGLLLGTNQGLIRYDGQQSFLWLINLGDTIVMNPDITALAWGTGQQLWVGTAGDGLFFYNGLTWEQYTTLNGFPADTVNAIYTDTYGAVWISAGSGAGGGALIRYLP